MEEPDISYIALHTHDRITFKRCRLLWHFVSPLRLHLAPKEVRGAFWFGTGIHFALEDYHSYKRFSSLNHAFQAYYNCFKRYYPEQLPIDHEDLLELGHGMLAYYPVWLEQRDEYQTLWVDGVPQVEVDFSIPLPELTEYVGKEVRYEGTFDKVVVDSYGRLWIVDYKTTKQFDTMKLPLDAQVSAYAWAAEQYYKRPVEGIIYLQLKKMYPVFPKVTRQGLSVDKRQHTTLKLFRYALIRDGYPPGTPLPEKYLDYLNELAEQETLEGDRFIRWDMIRRSDASKQFEYDTILAEGRDMLNPDVLIYPNPTRDCSYDCSFRSVHLAMVDQLDWEWLLETEFQRKEDDRREWMNKLKWENPTLPQLASLEIMSQYQQ